MQSVTDASNGDSKTPRIEARPFGRLWPFLKISFIGYAVMEVVYGVSNLFALLFFIKLNDNGFQTDADFEEQAGLIDLHQGITSVLYLALLFAAYVAYVRFYYRAMRNVTAVNAAGLKTSPFWAVGYFFVPIANLWKPLGAVKQIWRASFDPKAAAAGVPAMVGWWWFAWLAGNILSNISFRLSMNAGVLGGQITDIDAYMGSLVFSLMSAPFGVAAAILVLKISSKIMSAQEQNVISQPIAQA